MTVKADGVISSDPATELETEEPVQVLRCWSAGWLGLSWSYREEAVVPRKEAGEAPVGFLQGGRADQPELAGDTVLEGSPEALEPLPWGERARIKCTSSSSRRRPN